jgi:hypothetical protein
MELGVQYLLDRLLGEPFEEITPYKGLRARVIKVLSNQISFAQWSKVIV